MIDLAIEHLKEEWLFYCVGGVVFSSYEIYFLIISFLNSKKEQSHENNTE